jgi:hypothetical protein
MGSRAARAHACLLQLLRAARGAGAARRGRRNNGRALPHFAQADMRLTRAPRRGGVDASASRA